MSQYHDGYVQKQQATPKAEFMEQLSKAKAELKKPFLRKEASNLNLPYNLVKVHYSWGHPSSAVF